MGHAGGLGPGVPQPRLVRSRARRAFESWLATLARRRCLDLVRSPPEPSAAGPEDPEELLAWLDAPGEQGPAAERNELARAVEGFRTGLRPAWRDFFDLHFVQGLPYPEVAQRLSVSRIRCKYMKKVLAARAARDVGLLAALGRGRGAGRAP